jgi:hypothetical protein
MKRAMVLFCGILLTTLSPTIYPDHQIDAAAARQRHSINHGGKIESSYDAVHNETVMTLRKMKVTCDGLKDKFKGACTSIVVELHCPGVQISYVGYVRLKIIFETEAWDARHSLEQRNLAIVTDSGTLWFGRMQFAGEDINWTKTETLETTLSYAAFRAIMSSESVQIEVGEDKFPLREKNIAALRDLNSRVMPQRSSMK